MAGESEIREILKPTMLSRYNMFNMKSEIGIVPLVNSTVLTTIVGSLADEMFGGVIHYAFGELEAHTRALSGRSATKSISSI